MKLLSKYTGGSKRERAVRVIEAWQAGELPDGLDSDIREWFLDAKDRPVKEEALDEVFVKLMRENHNPDEVTYRRYRELCLRLGIPFEGRTVPVVTKVRKQRLGGRRIMLRVAAVLIPLFVLGAALKLWIDGSVDVAGEYLGGQITVASADGSQKCITLPDGSRVWLNTASTLSYGDNFAENRRVLLSGEAYFAVTKDAVHPFRVKATDLEVEVLGTEFNMRDYGDGTSSEVALASGRVEVTAAGGSKYILNPNDRLIYDAGRVVVERAADIRAASGWRTGLEFNDVPLRSVLGTIAAHFDVKIEGAHLVSDSDRVTVTFESDVDPITVMEILKSTFLDFDYRAEGDTIKIVKR